MITVKEAYDILKKEYPGKEVLLNVIGEYKDCYSILDMVSKEENIISMNSNWWQGLNEIAIMKDSGKILARFDKTNPNIENTKIFDEILDLTDDANFIRNYNTDKLY